MRKKYTFILMGLLSLSGFSANAQITEHFSNEPESAKAFSEGGSSFSITGGRMVVANFPTYGWTGTAKDDYYADNYGNYPTSAGVLGSFKIGSGSLTMGSLYVFPGETGDLLANTGDVIVRGKLSGATQYSTTIASGQINMFGNVDNGFTFVDLSAYSTVKVDEIEFEVTGSLRYLAVDAFKFTPTPNAPSVASVSVPANATYKIGDALNFTVGYDQNVTVTGTPQLPVTLSTGGTVNAVYQSGSGTSNLVFRHTVASGQLDADGIAVGSALLLNGGAIYNGATNALLALSGVASTVGVKVDGVAPTVTVASTSATVTYTSPVPVTVTFSETVLGFTAADVAVTNGTIGSFAGSGASYTFNVTPTAQGLVTVAVAADVAQDAAGNNNTAATSLTRTFDNINPTVVISTTATEPTNLTSIPVTVTFSEAVTDLTLSDFTVVNASLSALSGSGATYTLTAAPIAQGTVSISLPNGSVLDVAQMGNVASDQINRTFDSAAPTVTIASTTTATVSVAPIPITVTFNETVAGFTAADVVVTNGAIGSFAGSGASYTFNVTPTAQGLVTVAVAAGVAQDAAGNNNTAATSLTRTYIVVATSVDDADQAVRLSVYPNPTSGMINLSTTEGIEYISIVNLSGTTVWRGSADGFPLNISSFAKGVYLVNIAKGGKVETIKVVKKN